MPQILVLGATGKTGSRVVDRLAADGVTVRAASRHPGTARAGVVPTHFDWDDQATWQPALQGAEAVYVIPPAFVIDHVAQSTALFAAAKEAGVKRALLLSARGVDSSDDIPYRRTELALLASGLEASIIRPTWFAQNFTDGAFAPGVAAGVLAAPAADGLEPFIDADDIADVAAAILTDTTGAHAGKDYNLSGSAAYTFGQAAEILSSALGKPVAYANITPEEFVQGLTSAGVPADYAAMLASLFEVIRNGWDAPLSDGVQQVLGRPARSFEDWAATISKG
jgi:uncharacterized protein YbjT (DUF2867 family)